MWQAIKNWLCPVPQHRYATVELTFFTKDKKVLQKLCQLRKHKESGTIEILTVKSSWMTLDKVFNERRCTRVTNRANNAFSAMEDQESLDSDDSRQTYLTNVIRPSVSGLWRAITSFCSSFNLNASLTEARNSLIARECLC